jgi:hypothetical protein
MRDHVGCEGHILNTYDQRRTPVDPERPARLADWDAIMSTEEVILAGKFNAHSLIWNQHCSDHREHHELLEHLIEEYSLVVKNDSSVTRHPDGDQEAHPSIIDLTLVSPLSSHMVVRWKVLFHDEYATSSDHAVIESEFKGSDNAVDQAYLMRGWSLTPLLGTNQESLGKTAAAKADWLGRMTAYPYLDDASTSANRGFFFL